MSDDNGVIHGASDGGVSGKHGPPEPLRVLVAPSTSKDFNTVRHRPIPVACWKVEDIRFAFNSAFVTPDITTELKHLASLVAEHPGCPLSVFGQGVVGCRNRFWSDGEKRRSVRLPQAPREFTATQDTFACRFYQRISGGSPCESILTSFRVRLYDPDGRFIASAPCKITINNRPPYNDRADDLGIITLRAVETPSPCIIEWGLQPKRDEAPELLFSLHMLLVGDEPNQDEEARKKLNNLGYCDSVLKVNVEGFQSDYGDLANPKISPTGQLDQETMELLRKVYQRCADDLRHSKP